MLSFASRAGRWPLALTLAALAACADEPTGARVRVPTALEPHASVGDVILVTNTSGGTGVGSLPWALGQVTGGEIIRFDPSLAGDTIKLQSMLEAFEPVTIEGPADEGITISGEGQVRVFRFYQAGTLRNMTITGGYAERGSAIMAGAGPLSVEHTAIFNNTATNGAVIHGEDITLLNSTVSGNTSSGDIAGIEYAIWGKLTLMNSTVARNYNGAGIGWYGLPGETPVVTLRNSIVANNGEPQKNCLSTLGFWYEAMNISNDDSCGAGSGIMVADPLLGSMGDHGGPSLTLDLDPRSPAINAGISCDEYVDQRYVARDQYCDIGAFEFTDFTSVIIMIDATGVVDRKTGTAVIKGTLTCSRNETESAGLRVEVTQNRKGGQPPVQGTGSGSFTCSTTAQPWSATVVPSSGGFTSGSANVTVSAVDTPPWFKPARTVTTVKLGRR